MHLAPGTHLGRYEIGSSIGGGGMGEVYKAHDPHLGRFVAIKTLLAPNLSDPERRRRFAQEARAASALNHPGIITIYDLGSENGVDFIAMEFVEGRTLEELIPRCGMSFGEMLRYSIQASDAIARAHSAGILHRDLKPANIMVTNEKQVKVLDFGLAKLTADSPVDGTNRTASIASVTEAGRIMGTASYMSPEQAEGKSIDVRSDIFSFGAVLYEMVTGRRAFHGDTPISTIGCVLRDEPKPVREIREETPPELERLIRRCLRKDPCRRIQTMSDLKVALEELKEESDSGKLVIALPARRRFRTWTGVAGLACGLLALASVAVFPGTPNHAPATHQAPLTSYEGDERQPDFSPDGNQVAFTWNGEKQTNWSIYVKVAGSSAAPLRLTAGPDSDSSPKFSPDGKSIAFIRSRNGTDTVMLTSALGGVERPLASFAAAIDSGLSWSPDSKWLITPAGQPEGATLLRIVSAETGESKILMQPPPGSGGDFDPAFSPDGRSLAFVRERGMNVQELWVLPLNRAYEAQGPPRQVLADGRDNRNPVWSENSRELYFNSGERALAGLYRIPVDGSSSPVRIDALGDGVAEVALSARAHRLAFSHSFRVAKIWRLDMGSQKMQAEQFIASSSFRDAFPQYSPDGKKIAFFSNRTGLNQIWTCNADGTQPVQLTSMTGTTTGTPRWSPDGQWISFDSNSGGRWQIYVIPSGGGNPRALTSGDSVNVVTSWSVDGKWIYFASKRSGTEEVWRIPSPVGEQHGDPVQVTHHGGTSSQESPDGKTLYFTKTTPGFSFSLWKMPLNGGQESEVVPLLHRYNFSVARSGLYFTTTSRQDSPAEVKRLDFISGKIVTLYKLPKKIDLGITVSPDCRYLLFTQLDSVGSDLMWAENFR